jgi:DNA-binding NtrC family response regulator
MAKRTEKQHYDIKLVGGSEHIAKLKEDINYVAEKIKKHDFSVLIEGPSGTGKELIACEISNRSGRGNNFVPINCAALPGDLFQSELFGHEKGSFTGAVNKKQGLIKKAEGGILFLDEIGDLASEHQGKILTEIRQLLKNSIAITIG